MRRRRVSPLIRLLVLWGETVVTAELLGLSADKAAQLVLAANGYVPRGSP